MITIGCAHHDDFEGLWATVQSIVLHSGLNNDEYELVVVDNSPKDSKHRILVQGLCSWHHGAGRNVKYVDAPPHLGTTQSREAIFQYASGDTVVVMDCHVMLPIGALRNLKDRFDAGYYAKDLVSGPIYYNDLKHTSTHFADIWRGEMWGVWGSAWRCSCGAIFGTEQSCEITDDYQRKPDPHARLICYSLDPLSYQLQGITGLTRCDGCLKPFPDVPWAGHEEHLRAAGCQFLADVDDAEFDVPGQGLGLFVCRKDSWPGFNPNFRGFGGEEMYIHRKFRDRGGRTLCLSWLRWAHRFGRASGAPYPLLIADKVRNYVLGLTELGLPLDRCHRHFVEGGLFPQQAWELLVKNPEGFNTKSTLAQKKSSVDEATNRLLNRRRVENLDDLFEVVATTKRDLNEHALNIKRWAKGLDTILAVVKRREWAPLLAAGRPRSLIVGYTAEHDDLVTVLHDVISRQSEIQEFTSIPSADSLTLEPRPCDMLVIDTIHSADRVLDELRRFAPTTRKFILVRGTGAYGLKAEGSKEEPGLLIGLREFVKESPDWFVKEHHVEQYGMTLLAKAPEVRPQTPITPWPLGFGPGTELHDLLLEIGIKSVSGCGCIAYMVRMDEWGVDGCRQRRDEIAKHLREKAESWKWLEQVAQPSQRTSRAGSVIPGSSLWEQAKIAWKSVTTGLAFKVDWRDPFPGLVDEAIRLAAENGEK